MSRILLFWMFIFWNAFSWGQTVISPNPVSFSEFDTTIALTQIDTSLYGANFTLQNTGNTTQTYTIESALSGTQRLTIYTPKTNYSLTSKLKNTYQYFFSNLLQQTIELPPQSIMPIKCIVVSNDHKPTLQIQSEIVTQENDIKSTLLLSLFFGCSITIILYLLFLYVTSYKVKFFWLAMYLVMAQGFVSHRLSWLSEFLPAVVNKYPLFLDDIWVQLSIGTFVIFTIAIAQPNIKWRRVLYVIVSIKFLFFVTALIFIDQHHAIFSVSRKFSAVSTLVFIPIFFQFYRNQISLFLMFFTAMLGIGFTNSYLSHIDTHTIIESPSMYVWYYLPFIAHMILLAGTFLLEFKVLAEEHQHMSRSFSHAKEKNNSSFLKGMQSEHVNLANKITHSLLNPLTNLNKNHSKTTPQIDGEIKKVLTDLSRIVHGISADSNDFEWQMQELINAVSTPKKYTLNIFFNDNEVNDNLKNITIRITQEAINNIEKHAQASSVIIECFKSQTYFYLSIADNGVGFDPFQKTDGIGLKNMDKNAAKGNGKFSVTSSPLHGTTLLFSFKLI